MDEKPQAAAPRRPRYVLKPTTVPVAAAKTPRAADPFARPEAEDDDGYDPYSDRPAEVEAQFQRDPWE